MLYKNVTELCGKTPLMELVRYGEEKSLNARVLAKLEYFNPTGSVKDRVALAMLTAARERGQIGEGSVIIEPTSGNTGIGLAGIGAALGYRVILTMPESMSVERRQLIAAYGAEIVLTPAGEGMTGAVNKAEELAREIPGSFITGQFENPENPAAHYKTTGPEIWEDAEGKIDFFVAGFGTGGTVSGVGRFLKEKNPQIKIIAVEPEASPLLSQGKAGPHPLQGIGANFIPGNLDREIIDQVATVTGEDAKAACRAFAGSEGILVGISSGAALHAAAQIAASPENKGKTVVVLMPDSGEKYLSTGLFSD